MTSAPPDGALDAQLRRRFGRVAGVDEVGRGALAGPLTVAAVILDPHHPLAGLDDSKRVSPGRRKTLAGLIRAQADAWAVVHCSASEVDRLNVLQATKMAMGEAVRRLVPRPDCVVADAARPLGLAMPVVAEPNADGRYLCVAAASILAKVSRDEIMAKLAQLHPGFGWEHNRGYGTPAHQETLKRVGLSPHHRRSFAPARVLA